MAIIDLGSSLYIERNFDIKNFDISVGGFGMKKSYCPPEILMIKRDEDIDGCIDLEKSVSHLCGVTKAVATSIKINCYKKKTV
jgi:hypothetical protein